MEYLTPDKLVGYINNEGFTHTEGRVALYKGRTLTMETEKRKKLENNRTAKFTDRNGISIFAPYNPIRWDFLVCRRKNIGHSKDCKDNLSEKIEKQQNPKRKNHE